MSGSQAQAPAVSSGAKSRSDVSLIDVLPQHRFDEAALWRYLQQQLLERIQTSQLMARDRVSQPGPQHHELMLLLAFGRPHGATDCIVKAA